jgi:AcrR family transcriptional regulator
MLNSSPSAHAEPRTGITRAARATRDRVLAVAAEILRRDGYARLTMERVASVSGVAKTTVYRRWPHKAALCMELYLDVVERELLDPNTGRVESDLRHIAETIVRLQTQTVAGPAFVGLITERQISPETRDAYLRFVEKRRELTRDVLRRAIKRGQLQPDTDIDLVIDVLGGAVTFRLLQGHKPLNRKFAGELVSLVLSGCGSKPLPVKRNVR